MRCRLISVVLFAFFLNCTHSIVQPARAGSPQRHIAESQQKPSMGDKRRGEGLYQASCVVCHGTGAMGGIGPRLAGNPVLSNDQTYWKIVYEGRHIMPPLKGTVTDQQMADIRAWLRTLPHEIPGTRHE